MVQLAMNSPKLVFVLGLGQAARGQVEREKVAWPPTRFP